MRLLFVGFILKPSEVMSYKGASFAGNAMQLSYIKYLKSLGHEVDVLAFTPIAYFPKSRRFNIKSRRLQLTDEVSAYAPGFINLPFLKVLIQSAQAKKNIASWAKKDPGIPKTIITYNAIPQLARNVTAYFNHANIKTISILADPPMDQLNYSPIVKYFKKMEYKKTEKLIHKFNGIISLNTNSIKRYAPELPSIVIEGGVDEVEKTSHQEDKHSDFKRFIYAGALTTYSGCQELLDAIKLLPRKDIVFVFYGEGPLLESIESYAKEDQRVTYGGYLSRDEIQKVYQEADYLINPRKTDSEVSMYSFSSKLFDYLLSETPVLTTLFSGFPDAYIPYVNPINVDDSHALKESILMILDGDYAKLKKRAIDAKKWLLEEKNWTKQMKHLTEFIMKLHTDHKSTEGNL